MNVYEAKTQLSRLLRRVCSGEEIVIAVAGRPVARLVPYALDAGSRVLGGDEDVVCDAPDFNAPLPDAIVDAFYGARPVATAVPHRRRSARSRRRVKAAR